jgi:hypothetical protein
MVMMLCAGDAKRVVLPKKKMLCASVRPGYLHDIDINHTAVNFIHAFIEDLQYLAPISNIIMVRKNSESLILNESNDD